MAIWENFQPSFILYGAGSHVVPGCICRIYPIYLRQTGSRLPKWRRLPLILLGSEVTLTTGV